MREGNEDSRTNEKKHGGTDRVRGTSRGKKKKREETETVKIHTLVPCEGRTVQQQPGTHRAGALVQTPAPAPPCTWWRPRDPMARLSSRSHYRPGGPVTRPAPRPHRQPVSRRGEQRDLSSRRAGDNAPPERIGDAFNLRSQMFGGARALMILQRHRTGGKGRDRGRQGRGRVLEIKVIVRAVMITS